MSNSSTRFHEILLVTKVENSPKTKMKSRAWYIHNKPIHITALHRYIFIYMLLSCTNPSADAHGIHLDFADRLADRHMIFFPRFAVVHVKMLDIYHVHIWFLTKSKKKVSLPPPLSVSLNHSTTIRSNNDRIIGGEIVDAHDTLFQEAVRYKRADRFNHPSSPISDCGPVRPGKKKNIKT